jgi:hypothetical protein
LGCGLLFILVLVLFALFAHTNYSQLDCHLCSDDEEMIINTSSIGKQNQDD